MKKILKLLAVFLLSLSLIGCQSSGYTYQVPTVNPLVEKILASFREHIIEQQGQPETPPDPVVDPGPSTDPAPEPEPAIETIDEDGYYTSKEDVALYLHTYGHLPDNYITKSEAQDLGWVASKGNLWKVTDHMSIGGDRFGNREGHLPSKKGRKYYECDIDYEGGTRNAKRIVFSDDGLIYYTEDHYNTFELLYGEP